MTTIRELAVVSGALLLAGAAHAGDLAEQSPQRCDFFTFFGATTQATPESPFVGTIDFINLANGNVSTTSASTVLLGILGQDPATGTLTSITSHDIETTGDEVPFRITTFDQQSLVPLANFGIEDPDFDFGLLGRLVVKTGAGRYTCGEIVAGTGFDGAPLAKIRLADPVTGLPGETSLNGFAKLCRCDANDN